MRKENTMNIFYIIGTTGEVITTERAETATRASGIHHNKTGNWHAAMTEEYANNWGSAKLITAIDEYDAAEYD